MSVQRTTSDALDPGFDTRQTATDDGYFPAGSSVLRRVHGERIVGLLYGQRALVVGAAHPLAYVGTIVTPKGGLIPFARLAHTAKVHETVFFGTRAEADRALGFVRNLHRRVRGELPAAAGKWPAGTPYSADEPALILWTAACMADSGQALYEALVGRLSGADREAFWRDYVRFAELFGLPPGYAPATYAGFRAWWREIWASDDLHLTAGARQTARQVGFDIPVPRPLQPGMELLNLLLAGTLPDRLRKAYGLPWGPGREAAFRALSVALRGSASLLPAPLRTGGNADLFDLVARTERQRVRAGEAPLALVP